MADRRTAGLIDAHRSLRDWLLAHAYPVWWTHGADSVRGGFHERLNLDGTSTDEPRRARLHPRQIFAYAHAPVLGWQGPAARAVAHALEFFTAHYRTSSGLYRVLVAPNGDALDDRTLLYDQAFALLGFASAFKLTREEKWRETANELHAAIQVALGRPDGGFDETPERTLPLTSNSHMHLLEASFTWLALTGDERWLTLATRIIDLALERWIDPEHGAIRELFDREWRPLAGQGAIVEPGHQFEWAWLLLRSHATCSDARVQPAALRLIEFGERYGVDRRRSVAVNGCLADGRAHDSKARLWPQAERIKAGLAAAEATGEARYLEIAREATVALQSYFDTPIPGLWRDQLNSDGVFSEQPAPASSLYHIVSAALELQRALPSDASLHRSVRLP